MRPYLEDADFTLYQGDALETLRGLPDESVHCVVTSPPYWGLRDYGTEGQLGLEPTPDAYVANMVALFREVRRVLRRDGTCWLNLGDSYNGSGGAGGNANETRPAGMSGSFRVAPDRLRDRATSLPTRIQTLKPKDLVGIPWRVAQALQAPYCTGKIKDERERIWLAATVEAEGCLFIHRRKAGQSNGQGYERKSDSFGAGLEVASTDRVVIERCLVIAGIGSICEQTPKQNDRRKQTIYRWNVRSNECRGIIRELYPHMIAKQHEARLLLGCPSSGPKATSAWESLKALHQGGEATIDFAAPETLFEPGWYLRSDIVWSKCNPMPESVTDRPTKAHEYLFLLTRSPRYFYDADAIREPAEWARWGDQTNGKHEGSESAAGWIGSRSKAELTPRNDGERWNEANGRGFIPNQTGRNARSVWEIATQPYPEAHFATFPEELARRCIAAGTSERGCCPECGAPWEREVERETMVIRPAPKRAAAQAADPGGKFRTASGGTVERPATSTTLGWRPTCDHWLSVEAEFGYERIPKIPVPCVVLDPFMGSGTVAHVARKLGRRSIGIELNPDYCELAARRLQQQSLLA